MASWNLNFNAYGSGYQQPFFSDSTYGTTVDTASTHEDTQSASYFDRLSRSSSKAADHTARYVSGSWVDAGSPYAAQPSYSQSMPFDYTSTAPTVPGGVFGGYPGNDLSYANPASLSYGPEIPLSPMDDMDDEAVDMDVDGSGHPEAEAEPKEPPPKRKRGRPRLNRSDAESNKLAASHRVPHNQVERKYRETLNNEMERLRQNVPTLPQPTEGSGPVGPHKPSKATVLAAAVQYIKDLEAETEALADENEGLRSGRLPMTDAGPWRERRRLGNSS